MDKLYLIPRVGGEAGVDVYVIERNRVSINGTLIPHVSADGISFVWPQHQIRMLRLFATSRRATADHGAGSASSSVR